MLFAWVVFILEPESRRDWADGGDFAGSSAVSASAFIFLFRDSSAFRSCCQVSKASATVNLFFASTPDALPPNSMPARLRRSTLSLRANHWIECSLPRGILRFKITFII